MPQTNTTTRSPRGWKIPGRHFLQTLLLVGMGVVTACGSSTEDGASPARGGGSGSRPGGGFPGGQTAGTAVPVEVVEILPGAISAFIETNGSLEAEREVDIVARTGGPLVALNTEEGMQVNAGALLAQIDEAESRAQVEIGQVAVTQAEVAYNRARASLENAVVSQEVFDSAQSAFESAKAQLVGNEIQLGYTRIEAPFDGLIIERAVKFGETVTAGQRLFRISDFDPLLCTIGVPERDLTRLSLGQTAIIEVEAFPAERFEGRVLRISPVVDAATGTIRVTLAVDRQGRLSPGMFASVRLVTDVRPDALIMPKRALSLESLADSVFVVEDGVAYRRNITLGYEEDERVEVTSGLDVNDRVIVVGQDGLTDATPVEILAGPGAEEPAPRRAEAGAPRGGSGMTDERREAMRERMRARGLTDEQIEQRLAAMGGGGNPPDGRGRAGAPAGPQPAGNVAAPTPPSAEAPAPAAEPPASPPSEAPMVSEDPASPEPAAPESGVPESGAPTAPESTAAAAPADAAALTAAPAPPERRGRDGGARARGASARAPMPAAGSPSGDGVPSFDSLSPQAQETIRARLRSMGMTEEQIEQRILQGWGPSSGPGASGNTNKLTPEQIEALRERLRSQGMTEEQIEEFIARRRRSR